MAKYLDRPHLAVCIGLDFGVDPLPSVRRVSGVGGGWGVQVSVRRGLRVFSETEYTDGTEFPETWNPDEAEASLAIVAVKRLLARMGRHGSCALAVVGGGA